MKDYKTVKRFDNSPEANVVKNYLWENNILAVINDEYVSQMLGPTAKGIKLDVPIDQYEKAVSLIEEIESRPKEIQDDEIIEILEESGALLTGHFKLTSGLHSERYIEKIKLIQQPDIVVQLCELLIKKFKDIDCDVVIGLAMGGIALGYEVARQMGKQFIFTQRKDGRMVVRSGFDIKAGMKAIVIEDIVTTGGSVKEVLDLMESIGADVQAVGLLVDRTGGDIDFGVRTESLLRIKIEAYQPEDCPLCKQNIPVSVPGSSDKSLNRET